MDLQSRVRWEDYTAAKEEMFDRTNISEAPWWVVPANDKKRARLNCIQHLLNLVPYKEVPHETIQLPQRVFNSRLRTPYPAGRAVYSPGVLVPRYTSNTAFNGVSPCLLHFLG
jgi:hypothetical protein